MIINPETKKVLDVTGENCGFSWVQIRLGSTQHDGSPYPDQIWRFGENGSIINVKCKKALDSGKWCYKGAKLSLYTPNGAIEQNPRNPDEPRNHGCSLRFPGPFAVSDGRAT
jgi:hypothetical protein